MPTKNAGYAVDLLGPAKEKSSTFPELAVLLLDDHGELRSLSSEARSLLGITAENHSLPPALIEVIGELLSSGASTASKDLVLDGGAGDNLSVEVSVQRLAGAGNQNRLAIILSASRQTPESELHRLHRLASAGALSAGMAHEIKNALVAGKTFLQLLLEKNKDAELVEIVGREIERIDTLVSQMLRFTRPAKQKRAPVHIHQLLDLSLRLVQPQFSSKAIVVHRSLTAASDVVEGDEQQLEQAFLNLLMNSMEAMGPNGLLSIATSLVPQSPAKKRLSGSKLLEIRITDDGAGIAPHVLNRLFEPFFTTKKNGTGLGLAISRKIIKEHAGEILAESEPEHGATFRVLLPLAA